MTTRTTILATYTEERAADLMAQFLADLGVDCDTSVSHGPGPGSYHVCVATDLVGEAARLLELTQVAVLEDTIAAEIFVGRLVTERIPCVVGGNWLLAHFGTLGGDRTRPYPTPYTVNVPKRLLADAQRVVNEAPVSEAELTDLALRTPPGPDDQI